MTNAIKGKNLVTLISVIAWSLAVFFSAKLASAETNMENQDLTVGWYETEDALPGMHHHNAEKMIQRSGKVQTTYEINRVTSWYETEDALPFTGTQNSPAMERVERQENTIERLDEYSWIDTEDALPVS